MVCVNKIGFLQIVIYLLNLKENKTFTLICIFGVSSEVYSLDELANLRLEIIKVDDYGLCKLYL